MATQWKLRITNFIALSHEMSFFRVISAIITSLKHSLSKRFQEVFAENQQLNLLQKVLSTIFGFASWLLAEHKASSGSIIEIIAQVGRKT